MTRGGGIMLLCIGIALVAEARIINGIATQQKHGQISGISPALEPAGSKQFLKDFAGDKRPKVDVLHFKHPYPVVQDSEDFDKDFVKDENTDNGEFKAQTEYDRLRHKLASLKKEAAEALAKKKEEKKELDAAMREADQVVAKDQEEVSEEKKKVIPAPVKPDMPSKPSKPVKPATPAPKKKEEARAIKTTAKKEESSVSWSWPWSWHWFKPSDPPKKPEPEKKKEEVTTKKATTTAAPKPIPFASMDTSDATKAVQQAKDGLEKCKDELAQAKAELKKAMEDLEAAKTSQVDHVEDVKEAESSQASAENHEDKIHSKFTKESTEAIDAESAYDKQKAKTEQLKKDLEAAAAKVRAMRNAEDKDGGVYPTPTRSAASSMSPSHLLAIALAVVVGHHMA